MEADERNRGVHVDREGVGLSYRSELEGIFWSLKHLEYLNITPRLVWQREEHDY